MRSFILALFIVTLLPSTNVSAGDVITVENNSPNAVKLAAPGVKSLRVKSGEKKTWAVPESTPHGVDVKAWWAKNPRQLCVIFVRYDGTIKISSQEISGKEAIWCLGN